MLITSKMTVRQIASVQLHETTRRVGDEMAERRISVSSPRALKLYDNHYGPVKEQIETEIRQLHSAADAESLLVELAKLRNR